jgi:hypothetical protein
MTAEIASDTSQARRAALGGAISHLAANERDAARALLALAGQERAWRPRSRRSRRGSTRSRDEREQLGWRSVVATGLGGQTSRLLREPPAWRVPRPRAVEAEAALHVLAALLRRA